MAKEKSLQQRVMEAGFGAMLERHGFEKISATAYQKQHGKLNWKSVMGPGTDHGKHGKAWSLRDGTGYTLEGLNELLDAYSDTMGGRRETYGLAGTRHRVSSSFTIIGCSKTAYNTEHVPQPLRPAFFIERLFGIKPPRNEHDQFKEDYPHYRGTEMNANKTERRNYWELHPYDDVEKFTDSICSLWEKYVLADIQKVEADLDKGQLVKLKAKHAGEIYNPHIIKAYVAGQKTEVKAALEMLYQAGRETKDELIANLEQKGTLSKRAVKKVYMTREEVIDSYWWTIEYRRKSWQCLRDLLPDL